MDDNCWDDRILTLQIHNFPFGLLSESTGLGEEVCKKEPRVNCGPGQYRSSERILSSLRFISSTETVPASAPARSSSGGTGVNRIPWGESLTRSLIPSRMLSLFRCSTGIVT